MNTTSDAERELLEAERLCTLAEQNLERAQHELEVAKEFEGVAALAYFDTDRRRMAARRALQSAYQNEVTQ